MFANYFWLVTSCTHCRRRQHRASCLLHLQPTGQAWEATITAIVGGRREACSWRRPSCSQPPPLPWYRPTLVNRFLVRELFYLSLTSVPPTSKAVVILANQSGLAHLASHVLGPTCVLRSAATSVSGMSIAHVHCKPQSTHALSHLTSRAVTTHLCPGRWAQVVVPRQSEFRDKRSETKFVFVFFLSHLFNNNNNNNNNNNQTANSSRFPVFSR